MAIRSRPIIGLRIGERLQAVEPLIDSATLTRPSAAWAWGSDQLLDEYAADELRRDYDPATGTFRGVLVEESRTNQLLDNRDLSTGNWALSGTNVATQDAAGLDGTANTAWTITDDDSGNTEFVRQVLSIPDDGATHTLHLSIGKQSSFSDFPEIQLLYTGGTTELRQGTQINTSTGEIADRQSDGSSVIEDAGDWWHLSLSMTNNSTGNTNLSCLLVPARATTLGGSPDNSATGSVVYDFGQLELNTDAPSSLIETDGTAATRAADVLEGAFSESSGTLHFVGKHKGGDGVLWQADDGTEDNRIRLEVSGGNVQFVVDDGGTNQVSLNAGALASDGTYSVAARFDGSDFAVSLDGATAVTASSGTVPSVTTQRFGRDTSATVGLNWYETANYREKLLTNSELEALTA